MRLLGSLTDYVQSVFKKDNQDITLRPNQATTYTAARDIQLPPGDAAHVLTSADSSQTFTNKTIDGDDNTIQDLAVASLKTVLGQANLFLSFDGSGAPVTAKAVPSGVVVGTTDAQTLTNKTIDADNNTISNLAHGAEVDNPSSGVHGVTGSVVGTSDAQTLTNKTIDADTNTITNIENADIKAGAAIALDKLATLTVSRALETNGSGVIVASTVTSAELGHLSGVTSAIQTQIDGKQADVITTRGDLVYGNASNVADRLAIGASGTVLTSDGTDVSWQTPSGTGDVTAASNIADNALVRGDGGAKGIQQSGITVDDSDNLTGIGALTMSGNLTVDSSTFVVDTVNNKIGINSAGPNAFNANANDLVILDNVASGQAGITVATTGGSGVGNVFFADDTGTGNDAGGWSYAHATDTLTTRVADTNLLSLTSSQFSVLNSADFVVNTDTLFVDASADRVGINVAAPQRPLHVSGAATVARFANTGGVVELEFDSAAASNGFLRYDGSGNMAFYTLATEYMRLTSSGSLGINETSIDRRLHVSDNTSIVAKFENTAAAAVAIELENGTAANNGLVQYETNGDMSLHTNGSEKVRIEAGGFVGINTNNPVRLLHLAGDTNDTLIRMTSTDAAVGLEMADNTSTSFNFMQTVGDDIQFYTDSTHMMNLDGGTAGVVIGSSYAGAQTPPSNGLLVEGVIKTGTTAAAVSQLEAETSGTVSRRTRTAGTGSAVNPVDIIRNTAATTQVWTGIIFQDGDGDVNGFIELDSNANTATYTDPSDARLKTNIEEFSGLDMVREMRPVKYVKTKAPDTPQYGFLAQELYNIFPQAVAVGGEDATKQPWGIDYGKLTGVLTRAIQELYEEIQILKQR